MQSRFSNLVVCATLLSLHLFCANSLKAAPSQFESQISETKSAEPKSVISLIAPPADTATLRDLGQHALRVPENLLFDIVWGGWSFRWVHAGRATLELNATSNPKLWTIRSTAWCNGFFQSFYPVRDTVTSWIHAKGVYPLRFEQILNEGSYHFKAKAVFDQEKHRLTTQDTTLNIAPFTHDVLSAFYFIRTQKLTPGTEFELAAVSGKKAYRLRVLCHRRERVTVPAGEFQTLVVEPILKGDGLFKAKGSLLIWVTDEPRHLPVKMQSKIPVGSIKAELVRLPQHTLPAISPK